MRAYDAYRRGMGLTRRQVLSVTPAVSASAGVWWLLGSESAAGPVTTGRYASEQDDALQSIPCFCECANIGHRHDRDCYIKGFNRDGTVTWTSHSAT